MTGGGARRSGPAATTTTYTVRGGDTLIGIAGRHGTTARALAALNGLDLSKHIHPGQKLRVPTSGSAAAKAASSSSAAAPTPSAAPAPKATTTAYTVRSGDTLFGIAQRELGNGDLWFKIQKANPGLDPKKLRPGMKIKLPAQ